MPEIENVYEAARIAGCPRVPDGSDSAAKTFLQSCIDSGSDLYKTAAREQFSEDGVNDLVFEYAQDCVPIYTGSLWWGWVELGGFQSDGEYYREQGDFDPQEDLETIPQADFYMWAVRIIRYRVEY